MVSYHKKKSNPLRTGKRKVHNEDGVKERGQALRLIHNKNLQTNTVCNRECEKVKRVT